MRLVYRGQSYHTDVVPVDMAESDVVGHYRGQTVNFTYPRHVPVPQAVQNLKYRGVAYRTTATGAVEAIAPGIETRPAVAMASSIGTVKAAAPKSRQAMLAEVARAHRQNIQRSLQHRIEVARARGDEALVSILEREMQQIA